MKAKSDEDPIRSHSFWILLLLLVATGTIEEWSDEECDVMFVVTKKEREAPQHLVGSSHHRRDHPSLPNGFRVTVVVGCRVKT